MTRAALLALALVSCAPGTPPGAPTALMTWDDLDKLPEPKPDATERYGPDPYQVVDVWRPRGPGPHPVVLMIHGGCWQTKIADRTIMNRAAGDLRGRGIAVWNIDYRGFDRTGETEAMLADVTAADNLLAETASRHGLDASRVVVVGHSAGGHLALNLAARHRITLDPPRGNPVRPVRPLHVVSLGGLPDVEQAAQPPGSGCGVEIAQKLLASLPAEYFSAPRLLPLTIPQTLVNGDSDRIIPTHYAHDYAAKARAAGDEVTVHIVPGQGHVELIAPGTPAWARTVAVIEAALAR